MITNKNQYFHITTNNLSYIIGIRSEQYPENLYFGEKIPGEEDYSALWEKFGNPYGNSVVAEDNITLDNLCMEFSNSGTGDFRIQPVELTLPDGTYSTRFIYKDFHIYEGIYREAGDTCMPHARDFSQEKADTLELILEDERMQLQIILVYTAFEDSDVIVRRMVLHNQSANTIEIQRMMSMQLDLPDTNYSLHTFDGLWTRERKHHAKELISGTYVNESTNGTSSNMHNPFLILEKEGCSDNQGECLSVAVVYSGNHYEAVEVSEYGKLRIIAGLHDYHFKWKLQEQEKFYTPEAVLSYSTAGTNGLSQRLHAFIRNHIMPPQFAYKERPVLINNWEATYFDFNQSKLINIAKEAAKMGIELFVLDDGWFGKRNDDHTSLGDWHVNEKKLGCSLHDFAEKIKKLGLSFGLWMEPEMISMQSELYEAHPDWAVMIPDRKAFLGRNQYVLDYTNSQVRDYIVETLTTLLKSADVSYVKWDMNRPLTDVFSGNGSSEPGEFYHRYVLGLYEVMERLTKEFPNILWEGCSAGGNRFDLGILYYMPQIWTSDDTDADERTQIQGGTSYGYPLNSMGAHVSASPNHQTLRNTSLETRFQVACFGVLGYELDLTTLTMAEKKIIKNQVAFYKKYRSLFQMGDFYRGHLSNGNLLWQVVSKDKTTSIAMVYNAKAKANTSNDILRVTGLKPESQYHISARVCAISIKEFGNLVNQISPVNIKEEGVLQSVVNKVYMLDSETEEYIVSGALLQHAGIKLKQRFVGTGYNADTRVMGDYSSRLYVIEEVSQGDKGEEDETGK